MHFIEMGALQRSIAISCFACTQINCTVPHQMAISIYLVHLYSFQQIDTEITCIFMAVVEKLYICVCVCVWGDTNYIPVIHRMKSAGRGVREGICPLPCKEWTVKLGHRLTQYRTYNVHVRCTCIYIHTQKFGRGTTMAIIIYSMQL